MDSILTELRPSAYIRTPHLQILVNDRPIDEALSALVPEEDLAGLVPAIDFLFDEAEKALAIERFSDLSIGIHLVPLLICPDDLDFSCTVVIAEVVATETAVSWTRIGRDSSDSMSPEKIGSEVVWYDRVPPYHFSLEQYRKMIRAFSEEQTNREQDV